jgi:hypothetical protein
MWLNDRLAAHGLPACARRPEADAGSGARGGAHDRLARYLAVDRTRAGDVAWRKIPAEAPEVPTRARFRARLRHRPRPIDNADPRRERMQYAPDQFLYFTQPG